MYTVTQAFGISRAFGARWGVLNLATMSVGQIFQTYRKVYLTLQANFTPDPIYVDMDFFRVKYSTFAGNMAALLADNGNSTIETIPSVPTPMVKTAIFSDAFQAGYKAEIVGRNAAFGALIPRQDRKDIRIERPNPATDMQDVYNHCLISVNGLFHITDTDGQYLYVLDGGTSALKSRQNQLGIWSFKNVAPIKHVPLYEHMLYKQSDSGKFSDRTYIKLPDSVVTENKTVLLILGGYLVRPEKEIFFPVGNNTFSVNLGRLPLLQRYFESLNFIDYASMGLNSSTNNADQINLAQFYSDNAIRKYMTLNQSFIVVVDKEDLFFNQQHIASSNLPGYFTAYSEPKHPLFTGYGKVSEYIKQRQDGEWMVRVANSFLENKVFNYATKADLVNVSNNNNPTLTYFNSKGYMLEVGSDF